MINFEIKKERADFRHCKDILKKHDLLRDIEEMVEKWNDPEIRNGLQKSGWTFEHQVKIGKNRPRFDAFYESICAFEREKNEQMNVRSHILFLECAYREGLIQAAVIAVPDKGEKSGGASYSRTVQEFGDVIFKEYFPITCPFYVIGYRRKEQ